jgi:energy-coupling factor transporter ATP-binding protein EcfA2
MATEPVARACVSDLSVVAGTRTLLDSIGFETTLPARVAVMGANGAGKSMLLAALASVVEHRGEAELPEPVAAVLQDPESVFATSTVDEEIAFALACRGVDEATTRERVDGVVAAIGLGELRRRDPVTLSGGEQQRVQLAAAIVMRPRTLLLDEPTEFLDGASASAIEALLERLDPMPELVIRATHDPMCALSCDRLLVLEDGRAVAWGVPGHVLAGDPERLAAWGIATPEPLVIARALPPGRLGPPLPMRWAELEARLPVPGTR